MTIKTRLVALSAAIALASTGMLGMGFVHASPAEAAGCVIDVPKTWSVFNRTCSSAQHFNVISGKTYVYANAVGRSKTSAQKSCWANVTGFGALTKV